MMVMMSFINSFGQDCFQTLKNSTVYCFATELRQDEFLDSFNIIYCSPLYRLIMQDSTIPCYKYEHIKKRYEKFISSYNESEFNLVPNPFRVIETYDEFINNEKFVGGYNESDYGEIFHFSIIGKKEFFVNKGNIKSILIVEKYFNKKQIVPSIYIRLKSDEIISFWSYLDNFDDLKKNGLI